MSTHIRKDGTGWKATTHFPILTREDGSVRTLIILTFRAGVYLRTVAKVSHIAEGWERHYIPGDFYMIVAQAHCQRLTQQVCADQHNTAMGSQLDTLKNLAKLHYEQQERLCEA